MADASCTATLTNILPYFGFLFGVVVGSGSLVGKMRSDRTSFNKNARKQLAKLHNDVILSAREALGIKEAGDLPVLDYDNELLTTDH
jgi:hypothetical protein